VKWTLVLMLVAACGYAAGDDAPEPALSAIPKAPPNAVGVDHPPPTWAGHPIPTPAGTPSPTRPPPLPNELESPFDPPPAKPDAGPGGGTQL
jgi:hypothetical protein